MRTRHPRIDLGVRNLRAEVGDHIAFFWDSDEEFAEAVRFLEVGASAGDHLVVFGHEEANERVLGILGARGLDIDALRADEQISVLGPESTGDLMLARIGDTFQRALDAGAPMIRLLGNIGWGHSGWPEEVDILRFEARVTAAAESFPCIVVCMYDVNAVSGSILLNGAFCTHPVTIYHNLIRENPTCVAIDDYLERLDARAEAAHG